MSHDISHGTEADFVIWYKGPLSSMSLAVTFCWVLSIIFPVVKMVWLDFIASSTSSLSFFCFSFFLALVFVILTWQLHFVYILPKTSASLCFASPPLDWIFMSALKSVFFITCWSRHHMHFLDDICIKCCLTLQFNDIWQTKGNIYWLHSQYMNTYT